MGEKVDVQVLNDLLRAARFYCDREGAENCSNYANDMLERGEKCIAAVAELIEADREYDKAYEDAIGDPSDEGWLAKAEQRRLAALANVGGAA